MIIKNTLEGERPDLFWDNGEKNLLKSLLLYINSGAYTGNQSLGELYKLLADDKFTTNTMVNGDIIRIIKSAKRY